jgi:hypothetical protein
MSPVLSIRLVSMLKRHFALALIFTLIVFVCVGSSLVILTESLVDPFFVGAKVIVTVLLELG